jgi:anti-sigma B factor antagonist
MSAPLMAALDGGRDEVRVALSGDINGDADAAMAAVYARAVELDAQVIVLDFHAVDYINSTGIALIVRLLADARRAHRSVHARGLSAHYEEIFRITRLSDFMTLEPEPTSIASN